MKREKREEIRSPLINPGKKRIEVERGLGRVGFEPGSLVEPRQTARSEIALHLQTDVFQRLRPTPQLL